MSDIYSATVLPPRGTLTPAQQEVMNAIKGLDLEGGVWFGALSLPYDIQFPQAMCERLTAKYHLVKTLNLLGNGWMYRIRTDDE